MSREEVLAMLSALAMLALKLVGTYSVSLAAWAVLWYFLVRRPSRAPKGPTEDQLPGPRG